jgi:O-antigen ligase
MLFTKSSISSVAMLALLLSSFFQAELFSIGELSIRPLYLFSPIIFIYSFLLSKQFTSNFFTREIIVFLAFIVFSLTYGLILGIAYEQFNFAALSLIVIGLFSCISALNLAAHLGATKLEKTIDRFSLMVLILLIGRILVFPEYIPFLLSNNRAELVATNYPFFVVGGWNIELTSIAFISLITPSKKLKLSLIFYTVIFSLAFQSRSGIIAVTISLLLFLKDFNLIRKNTRLLMYLCAGVLLLFATPYILQSESFEKLSDRMLDINQELSYESSGEGRLTLWSKGLDLFSDSPFGLGVGNSVVEIKRKFSMTYLHENNLHNIYIQALLDLGLLGFTILISISLYMLVKYFKGQQNLRVFAIYFCIGMIQFFLYDPAIWLYAFIFHSLVSAKQINLKKLSQIATNKRTLSYNSQKLI